MGRNQLGRSRRPEHLACVRVRVLRRWRQRYAALPFEAPALSQETQLPESPESPEPPEPPGGADSDTGASTETNGSTPENPSGDTNESAAPNTDEPSGENLVSDEASDTLPPILTRPEEVNPPADVKTDEAPVETSVEENPNANSAESADKEEASRDGKIEGKQKTPEEEALDKLEQANAIYEHMSRLAGEIDALQARYDELKAASDKASSHHKKTREALKLERKKLKELKEELSSHIVKMYKQGGATPYLDVLCSAASYE